MYKLMIVEDDTTITDVLSRQLTRWGYAVLTVTDFMDVRGQFERERPDLILLDISLPYYDGFYWCREIRKISKTPIIFMSSAGDDMNLVMAINMGADDFIAKPFTMEVMTAKIQAWLRRTYSFAAGEPDTLQVRDVTLSLADGSLSAGENRVELTKNEYKILKLLMEHAGRIVSREDIMNTLWETEHYIDDNTLTVNMTRLRRKLAGIGVSEFIETKKGLGYLIADYEHPL